MAGPVKDREAFQRLSFLYQDPMNQALARFYCYTERTIAKRLVLRRDPSVKRTLCRGCSSLLIPGLTCTQRQRRCRGQRWTVQTCLTCQRSQRFLNDPDHLLWGDRPEAQLGSQAGERFVEKNWGCPRKIGVMGDIELKGHTGGFWIAVRGATI
ncbi:ribonuclease P protein subunit p21 isoform X2 [Enhydra lutris kenyoni]|uniref:Ribonuclease P protein subunit p21 isoform X2 n=1 Tax=Enhydra lutris kenyoni TaxID=391180 RepID=A0A2Y9K0P3_ENHLU|nr:ribonuclease P protein subunit p21 isoform X2 [Enhydra lutris kenyoni]